jgi:cellulose synthase/poly-beta-1,6-N-acetylglucosamine synthase-like glycosyltransferase
MIALIFWTALIVTIWVYLGYPLLLLLWRSVGRHPIRKKYQEPTVSIVMAMHNEASRVDAKMENCFSLDYPISKVQIIVSLDAPTDGTEQTLEKYQKRGVVVVRSEIRKGKAAAINSSLPHATGDIVLFGDARQKLAPNALRELVANFSDPSVGAVSGELILLDPDGKESKEGVGMYWRYEKALRSMESDILSVPGSTGAIYAIRRELFQPLPVGTILDDVLIPMRIVVGGKRAIFEPAAHAYDQVTQTPTMEYEKKRRTLMGNYELLVRAPELLLPGRNPIFLQFLSHKVGRLIVPWCLLALLISNLFLRHGFYLLSLSGQILFYLFAIAGWFVSRRKEEKAAMQMQGSSLKHGE